MSSDSSRSRAVPRDVAEVVIRLFAIVIPGTAATIYMGQATYARARAKFEPRFPMSDDPLSDARIVASWLKNASPWTSAVRENQIESRRLVTNQAIVDAVLKRSPETALDIGCGEGWLVRALAAHRIRMIGVDVVPSLIEQAKQAGGGEFRVASYESIAAGELDVEVDAAVANFSLIGKESVENLVSRVPDLLRPGGAFIVQTLHPLVARVDLPYEDGWRTGSWAGFSDDFSDPAPWYFRTVESWKKLLTDAGLRLTDTREPLHPATGRPASIIFIAESRG
jgi:2-polyprenyl-3-methyl-5-hydroxy-6-metoxy-1,4-benzoquinol methylase